MSVRAKIIIVILILVIAKLLYAPFLTFFNQFGSWYETRISSKLAIGDEIIVVLSVKKYAYQKSLITAFFGAMPPKRILETRYVSLSGDVLSENSALFNEIAFYQTDEYRNIHYLPNRLVYCFEEQDKDNFRELCNIIEGNDINGIVIDRIKSTSSFIMKSSNYRHLYFIHDNELIYYNVISGNRSVLSNRAKELYEIPFYPTQSWKITYSCHSEKTCDIYNLDNDSVLATYNVPEGEIIRDIGFQSEAISILSESIDDSILYLRNSKGKILAEFDLKIINVDIADMYWDEGNNRISFIKLNQKFRSKDNAGSIEIIQWDYSKDTIIRRTWYFSKMLH